MFIYFIVFALTTNNEIYLKYGTLRLTGRGCDMKWHLSHRVSTVFSKQEKEETDLRVLSSTVSIFLYSFNTRQDIDIDHSTDSLINFQPLLGSSREKEMKYFAEKC